MNLIRQTMVAAVLGVFTAGCGQAPEPGSLKVSNGQETADHEHQSVVMLYYSSGANQGSVCTGTFIDHDTLITAAHCTMGGDADRNGRVDLTVNVIKLEKNASGENQARIIAESTEIHRHPQWDAEFRRVQVNAYDLAVIRFPAGTAPETSAIRSRQARTGERFTIVGFGLNHVPRNPARADSSSVGTKRHGRNTIDSVSSGFINFSGVGDFTNGDGDNVNSAPGDSGGPMFIGGELVGVTSGGGRTLFGGGRSAYIDLHSSVSRSFLRSRGIDY